MWSLDHKLGTSVLQNTQKMAFYVLKNKARFGTKSVPDGHSDKARDKGNLDTSVKIPALGVI